MSEVKIDTARFFERLNRLVAHWDDNSGLWGGSKTICIPMGTSSGEQSYSKMASLHLYLLGYEFPDTLMVITKTDFYFMGTSKKCGYLKDALSEKAKEDGNINLHLLEKSKDDGQNREYQNDLLNHMRKSGKIVGCFLKTVFEGKFVPGWMDMLKGSQLELHEITPSIGDFLSIKDSDEMVSSFPNSIFFVSKLILYQFSYSNNLMLHLFPTN